MFFLYYLSVVSLFFIQACYIPSEFPGRIAMPYLLLVVVKKYFHIIHLTHGIGSAYILWVVIGYISWLGCGLCSNVGAWHNSDYYFHEGKLRITNASKCWERYHLLKTLKVILCGSALLKHSHTRTLSIHVCKRPVVYIEFR